MLKVRTMKKVLTIASVLVLNIGGAFSQGITDAYKLVPNGDLHGTARSLGMAGAFGALGGDISVLNNNPAGLAVYRSSEFAATIDVTTMSSKANWNGQGKTTDKTNFNFDNIAYVSYFPTGNDEGLLSWNVGFSYNRLKSFNRNYSMAATGANGASLADYIASRANVGKLTPNDLDFRFDGDNVTYNPYDTQSDWLSVLANDAGFLNYGEKGYESSLKTINGTPYERSYTELNVNESGAIDQYTLGFGTNISDRFLLGASFSVTDMKYDLYSYYAEDYEAHKKSYIELENGLTTKGTGFGVNVGAIIRPVDYLRFGIAYNSPTWYKLTDYYYAEGGSDIESLPDQYKANSPENAMTKYKFRTPDKWIFSAAAIIGQTALVSLDYEMMNYRRTFLSDEFGVSNGPTNDGLDQLYGVSNTIKFGTEIKVTPQFAVRAGVAWSGTGMKNDLTSGNREVVTVGTLPHYTLRDDIMNYSVGFGYRFTPQFYADIACVVKSFKDKAYSFSTVYSDAGGVLTQSNPASLKNTSTRVALTLGYKF